MFSWLAKRLITRNMERLNAGDPGPTLRLDAKDVQFRFPGRSSWSGEYHGKEEVEQWLKRLVDIGLQHSIDEVIAQGPPWRTTVCLRGRDHLDGPDGRRIYENRYVIWGHLAWGLLKDYEVYEDTEATLALDEELASLEKPAV